MADIGLVCRVRLSPGIDGVTQGFRVRIDAIRSLNMPLTVFAYYVKPVPPPLPGQTEREPVAEFSHICSPVDLEEYPEYDPDNEQVPEFFRLSGVDISCRNRAQRQEFLTAITNDLLALQTSLRILDEVETDYLLSLGDEVLE